MNPTVTQTGTTYSASASQYVVCNITAGLTITFPTAPANGTLVGAINLSTSTALVSFAAGGSDSVNNTSVKLGANQDAVWVYNSNTTTWLLQTWNQTNEDQISILMGALI
jgi:hypothetical protein